LAQESPVSKFNLSVFVPIVSMFDELSHVVASQHRFFQGGGGR